MRICLLATIAAACLGQLLLAPDSATAAISTPPDCNSSFNVYDYTPDALAACGISTFPLTSLTPLSGGGDSYDYRLSDGSIVHFYMPPVGFDPLTATSS